MSAPSRPPGLSGQPVGVDGGHHLAQEDAEGVAGHAQVGDDQHHHEDGAHAALHQQVAGQRPVAAVGLEQTPVDAEQDPDPGRHQNEHHTPLLASDELTGDPTLQDHHDHDLDGQGDEPDAVDLS